MSQKKKHRKNRKFRPIQPTHSGISNNTPNIVTTPEINQVNPAKFESKLVTSELYFVKKDFIKIFAVITIIITMLITLVLTNDKSGWLDHFANILYNWLRLGQ